MQLLKIEGCACVDCDKSSQKRGHFHQGVQVFTRDRTSFGSCSLFVQAVKMMPGTLSNSIEYLDPVIRTITIRRVFLLDLSLEKTS